MIDEEKIINFISNTLKENNFSGTVLGVSGGIDSAVVLGLLVKTIDKTKIKCYILPERDSSPESVRDAKLVCDHFGVDYEVKNITSILKALGIYKYFPPAKLIPWKIRAKYAKEKWKKYERITNPYEMDVFGTDDSEFLKGLSYYRAKHRVRMVYLYKEAEARNYAVVGTTNRTEFLTGLYVKWGDDSTDIEPIMHLFKTEIYELAKQLEVPEKIIKKPASPDLIPGLTDEEALGLNYYDIDRILKKIINNIDLSDEDQEKVKIVKELYNLGKMRNSVRNLNLHNNE
ncbi:MAG: NAD(+) synthase [Thermosipho sp. (in: Bacteria)]|nr:NAD(+) synthase [Thermosipho sp. (in: thermotogales)]